MQRLGFFHYLWGPCRSQEGSIIVICVTNNAWHDRLFQNIQIDGYIPSSFLLHSFVCTKSAPSGGIETVHSPPVASTIPVLLMCSFIKGLNWPQANTLCHFVGIDYYAMSTDQKGITPKKTKLQEILVQGGANEWIVSDGIWEALRQLKGGAKPGYFDKLLVEVHQKWWKIYGWNPNPHLLKQMMRWWKKCSWCQIAHEIDGKRRPNWTPQHFLLL